MLLAAAGTMPPLRDEQGHKYRSDQLPCADRPAAWDYDATVRQRAYAAARCRGCPAVEACARRREQYGDLVSGTWAGYYFEQGSGAALVYDAAVAAWLHAAGIDLAHATEARAPTRRGRPRAEVV